MINSQQQKKKIHHMYLLGNKRHRKTPLGYRRSVEKLKLVTDHNAIIIKMTNVL